MLRKLIVLSLLICTLGLAATSTAQAKQQSYIVTGLLCIHQYEGSWTDPNAPYWGGLQMDMNFQHAYGFRWVDKYTAHRHKIYFNTEWGTADRWPIWAQKVAGIHGYFARGWEPWYNTAHLCGLI